MKQALEDVIRPGSPADLDFIIVEELVKKSGTKPEEALQFSLHELLCNSLDSDATQVWIDARRVDEFHQLTVADNGSKKIQIEDLRLILDFTNKASSKRGFLRVSRGYLGNALKSIFGFTHALAESKGLTPPTITVESHGSRYSIDLKPNRVKGKIESTVKEERPIDNEMTAFIIKLPSFDQEIPRDQLYDIIFATSMETHTEGYTMPLMDWRAPWEWRKRANPSGARPRCYGTPRNNQKSFSTTFSEPDPLPN
jgi:hypothetical protein